MLLLVGRNILYMSHFPSVRSKWVDIWLLHHFSHGPTLKIPFLGPSLVPNPTELLATQANIAQVLSCMCMDRDKLAKKEAKPIFSHLDRTSLVNKRFIIWLLGKCFLQDTACSPEQAR